jgi:short-subunit dehydrogenase
MARNEKRLNEVAEKVKKLGVISVKTYICDIRKTDKLESTIKSIISDF